MGVAERLRAAGQLRGTTVTLATAHPAKFPDVIDDALGIRPKHPSLEALRERRRILVVPTKNLHAFIAYEQGAMLGEQLRPRLGAVVDGVAGAAAQAPLPSLHYLPTQAGDGRWVQLGNLLPHLFDNFLVATELVDILADPDYDTAQMNLPEEKREHFRDLMFLRMQQRTAAEWIAAFVDNGSVVAGLVQSTQDALGDPDMLANGHVIDLGGCLQLGPLARLSATPAQPRAGVADGAATARAWQATPRAVSAIRPWCWRNRR